jgi:hypothetical protein
MAGALGARISTFIFAPLFARTSKEQAEVEAEQNEVADQRKIHCYPSPIPRSYQAHFRVRGQSFSAAGRLPLQSAQLMDYSASLCPTALSGTLIA